VKGARIVVSVDRLGEEVSVSPSGTSRFRATKSEYDRPETRSITFLSREYPVLLCGDHAHQLVERELPRHLLGQEIALARVRARGIGGMRSLVTSKTPALWPSSCRIVMLPLYGMA